MTKLNDAQLAVVHHKDGPMLVLSGAGTGKTKVITKRADHLVKMGVDPREMLIITFTNRAANDLERKISPQIRNLCTIGTIHRLCCRLLKEFSSSRFHVFDAEKSHNLITTITKEKASRYYPSEIASFIDRAKALCLKPDDITSSHPMYDSDCLAIYARYQRILKQDNALDFGDLLMQMQLLMQDDKRIRTAIQSRFRYVMLDEAQDTNRVQFDIIKAITEDSGNLLAVGDDDQAIYRFRGAEPDILNKELPQAYPSLKIRTLEQNYRCSGNIVAASSGLIGNNKQRRPKNLWTDNPMDDVVEFGFFEDRDEESRWIASQIIKETKERGLYDYGETAILVRTNWQVETIMVHLARQNIPYSYTPLEHMRFPKKRYRRKKSDGVNLMTLHASKGLEFKRVYIAGVEQNLLPHKKGSVEEERSLLYVGMTRANEKLSLSARYRNTSEFLSEIPRKHFKGNKDAFFSKQAA